MSTRAALVLRLVFDIFCSAILVSQQKPSTSIPIAQPEFPVVLQQNVAAGKTPVGTKIQAKLVVATLVEGAVVPKNTTFLGEVTESAAKTKTTPSRLAIRIDSVQWKDATAPLRLYLTSWYYPTREVNGQGLEYGPEQPANRTWNGQGQYPDPNSKVYRPFPDSDKDKGSAVPETPASTISNQRVRMKDVESLRTSDGAIVIASSHSNLKLDKLTTYVLALDDFQPAK